MARSICVAILHTSYEYGFGLKVGGDYERSQYNNTIFFLYVTIGIVCVSNFKCFLLGTTPLFVIGMGVNIYLMIQWPSEAPCDCSDLKLTALSEIAHYSRLLLPVLMGIYFQNKTLVTQFTAHENEETQQQQIEQIFMAQPDGVVILTKIKKPMSDESTNNSNSAATSIG